jgi:large subunit ribosomal protein L21
MLAVIETGGKQYLVEPGKRINVEKIEAKEGEEIILDKVLLLEKDGKVLLGTPYLENVKVIAKVIKQGKKKKVIVLKYKRKTRYKVKRGHRQPYTRIEILKIES